MQNKTIIPKKQNPNIFSPVIQDSCSKGVVTVARGLAIKGFTSSSN